MTCPSSSRSATRRPSLVELHREFTETLTAWGRAYEIIIVDDGSTDESFAILARLQARDPRLRVIRFRRNFGQTAAFAAGFAHARGRLIVTSDGDLQNDPHDIPAMVEQLEGGFDIVCGWRKDRKDAFVVAAAAVDARQRADLAVDRRAPARLRLLAEGVPRRGRQATEAVRRDASLPAGDRQRAGRRASARWWSTIARASTAQSKYGIARTIRVVLDLLTVKFLLSYSTRPLQIFGLIGLAMGLAGAVISGGLAVQRLREVASLDQHMPLLLLGILLIFTGVQLVTLGLLAELQVRTYHESQNKPIYVIREILQSALG